MRNSTLGLRHRCAPKFNPSPVQIETLEDRRLLSAAVSSVPVVTGGGNAGGGIPPVTANAITPVGVTINAQTGVAFSGVVGKLKNLKPSADITIHASINWGDGSAPSDGTVTADASGVTVSGSHTYFSPATYAVTVQATGAPVANPGGPTPAFVILFPAISSKAAVTGDPIRTTGGVTLNLKAGTPFTGVVGFYASPILDPPLGYAASINWGDGASSAATLRYAVHGTVGGYDIIGSHTFAKAGTFKINTAVTQGPINSNIKLPTRIVAEIPSKAIVTSVPQNSAGGVTINETVNKAFTAAVGTFNAIAPATGLHASITWGDGTTSAGTLQPAGIIGIDVIKFNVVGTHTYAKVGTYPIHIVVTRTNAPDEPTTSAQIIATIDSTAIVKAPTPIV